MRSLRLNMALAVLLASSISICGQDKVLDSFQKTLGKAGIKLSKPTKIQNLPGFYSSDRYLVFQLDESPLQLPRQYGVVEDVFALSPDGKRHSVSLRQDPRKWFINFPDADLYVGVMRFRDSFEHHRAAPTINVKPLEIARFPARLADVNPESDKLQFEPLAYKNTVGYWVNPKDTPHWNFRVEKRGRFRVRILQGCGKGQGGSEITIRIGKTDLAYTVKETGHFQTFRWFEAGEVSFDQASTGRLSVLVRKLAKNAVMDIREIQLVPWKPQSDSNSRPNVLIFYTDDQGTLDANCFGSRDLHTPNIDGLAHSGVRFTQAYAHTVCCPSRAMLMTGRVPQRSNVNNWTQGNAKGKLGRNMKLDEMTIAEYLQKAGYKTALFGKWHLGAALTHGPTKQGFDQFFGIRGGFIDNFNHHFLHGSGFHDLYEGTREVFQPGDYFPDQVTNRAMEFISANDSPFLLMVPFNVPHYPEQADAVFEQRYSRMKQPRKSYAKTVSTTDERIGRILRHLEYHEKRDNTIIVFMSDNGHSAENYAISVNQHTSGLRKGANYGANGGGGNTGKWRGHKGTFFEGGIRVPAIISFPKKLPSGITRDQPITACDWMPTILDLCGVKPVADRKLDGESLLPIIQDNAPTHHKVMHWQWQNRWAVRKGNWKLIGNPKKVELFNLNDDLPESRDHAKDEPELVKSLRNLHDQWLASTKE